MYKRKFLLRKVLLQLASANSIQPDFLVVNGFNRSAGIFHRTIQGRAMIEPEIVPEFMKNDLDQMFFIMLG